jgi:CubicO group peptidase (beta-lactamase class C family)
VTSNQSQPIDGNMLSLQHATRGRKMAAAPLQTANMLYAGLLEYLPGTASGLYVTPSWDDLLSNWNQAVRQKLRMCSIDTDEETEGNVTFLAAYIPPDPPGEYALLRTADWSQFLTDFNNFSSVTRLLDFDIHPQGGVRFYTGTWGGGPAHQILVPDLGWDDFISKWKELSNAKMRLIKVQVFPAADSYHLTGLFEEGSGGYAFVLDPDKAKFLKYYNDNQGTMQLTDFHVYDQPPTRYYVGVWRETQLEHRFLYDLDWGSFLNQTGQLEKKDFRIKKVVRYANPIELPEPQWAQYFAANLAGVAGYAFAVLQNGRVVASGAQGQSRLPTNPPATKWTTRTRMRLASVSKTVTAVAMLKILSATGHSINDAFYPLIQSRCPQAGPGVNTVTFANLLTMKSGMKPDGILNVTDIWAYLSEYMQKPLDGTPGITYAYSNTNFTILQAIISILADPAANGGNGIDPYVKYVSDQVLKPMGVSLTDFNPVPDPESTATLAYGISDTRPGQYWGELNCVGPGGWVSSAEALLKFAAGVRNNVVLTPDATAGMFMNEYGWYIYDGLYGQYFHHNGMLVNGLDPRQGLGTGLVHFAGGYDAVLLVNSEKPQDIPIIDLMIGAFEQRF